jgi:hypothetical protein
MGMRRVCIAVFVLLALVIAAAPAPSQEAGGPANLGFEDGPSGQAPSGWRFDAEGGSAASVSAEAARTGAFGVEVRVPALEGQTASARPMQRVDASPFRGRRVRLSSAAAKVSGANGGYFWIQAVDAQERSLAAV